MINGDELGSFYFRIVDFFSHFGCDSIFIFYFLHFLKFGLLNAINFVHIKLAFPVVSVKVLL